MLGGEVGGSRIGGFEEFLVGTFVFIEYLVDIGLFWSS